jgi:hypothetical protein
MTLLPPFAGLLYEGRDEDLVRFRENPIDDTLSTTVRSIFDSLDEHRDDVRQGLGEDDCDLLILFARRRTVGALRENSLRAVQDALDAYALLPTDRDVPWESWFKATLVIGRHLGLVLDDAHQRFSSGATEVVAERADVAFDGVERITDLAQCHVIEVTTSYGVGLLETTVVREQASKSSWGGITGLPVVLGQYQVNYSPTTNLAEMAVAVADALDASGFVTTSAIHQDQLVASTFDLVTSGSYLDSLGCLSFFADGAQGQPTFAVVVAEVASEEHYDVQFKGDDLAQDLAEAADTIEEQSALATGSCVVVVSALPDFGEDASDYPIDLSSFLEIARSAITPA